ncbi:hypothetical protein LIER_23226 [Lithospermum erythrorhizon]|uniref:Uncharacterized protein n=1 Tax=Lithospermum erythrorhizon TaxID=34254 RepID=A0AAV3QY65_LITER
MTIKTPPEKQKATPQSGERYPGYTRPSKKRGMKMENDSKLGAIGLEEQVKATSDELKEVNLGTTEHARPTYVNALLILAAEAEYIALLTEFRYAFAWTYTEMPALDPKVAMHHLAMKKGARPVKQGQRRFQPELVPSIEA